MKQKIVINCDSKLTRVALLENNKVAEIYFERPLHQRLVGNIYKGVVENVLPGMQAAFVDVGEEKNAFYYVDDIPQPKDAQTNGKKMRVQHLLHPKKEVLVQVMKESIGSKGARLTGHITIPGRYLVLMPGLNYVGVSRRIESQQERERLKKEMEDLYPPGVGVIVRTVAEGTDPENLKSDLDSLLRIWKNINKLFQKEKAPALLYRDLALVNRIVRDLFNDYVEEMVVDNKEEYHKILGNLAYFSPHLKNRLTYYDKKEPIFDYFQIEEEIERSLNRMIWLKCGGYLVFDETEALTAIDVNTGKYTGKRNLEDTILKTNLEAVVEIARQVRLRDIGGIIIIDLIDMDSPENRRRVVEKLKQEMNKDRTKSQVLGITSLGLVEVSRKKVKQSISEVMLQPCAYCHGKGKTLSLEAVSSKVERELKKMLLRKDVEAILVETNSEVAALLIGSGGAYLKKLEASTGKNIFIRGSDNLHVEKYSILMSGPLQEVARHALPVVEGGIYRVQVEEPHSTNPDHGIARLHGYVLDIEDGGGLVGEEVQVVIKETTRTFAKAVLWKRTTLEDNEF